MIFTQRRSLSVSCLVFFLIAGQLVHSQSPDAETLRLDRLTSVAKLWAAVKFFHPYLAYRDDIDWDSALVKAIPKVNAAKNAGDYSDAVAGMLAVLGDPATRVLATSHEKPGHPSAENERRPTFRMTSDNILVVDLTNYSDLRDFTGSREKFAALKKEIPKARAVLFDLRPSTPPTEDEQGSASYSLGTSGVAGMLTAFLIPTPGERRRMHVGFAPQNGSTSGDYSSGFYAQGRQAIKPAPEGKDVPAVFLLNSHSDLLDMALGFQAAGKGAIVVEGEADDSLAVTTQVVHLGEGVRAQIRLGELVYEDGTGGFAPNLKVPPSTLTGEQNPALQAALQLAKTAQFGLPNRPRLSQRTSATRDKTYEKMQYPATEYRVLAAFRLWAVINYFFPYKEFIGEDWDQVLRDFISRFEQAKDATDYNLTVAEMVAHFHDTHGFVISPFLQKQENAALPIRVRMIEGLPVITGFSDAAAATSAGFEIGDVILKVDGEDVNQRITEKLKYQAASTPQAAIYYAVARSVARGPDGSVVKVTIRDLHDQVRDVTATRKTNFVTRTQGDRSGEILRILPGNFGYADLDRLPVAQVDEMFEKFKDCPAIIFDNRGYPQGTAWKIAPRLTDKNDVVAALFKRKDPMSPDLPNGDLASSQVQESFYQRLPHTDKLRYHGRTVMLIDERTISQAEHTGLFFEAANGTKFVGSPTQGANGDVTNLSLPGAIYVHFSGQGVWHADGRQLQRLGLQPDVEAHPTLAGIRAGKDEVLDTAVEYLKQTLPAAAKP